MVSEPVGTWTRRVRWDEVGRMLAAWGGGEPHVVSYARDHLGSQRAGVWGLDTSTATDLWPYGALARTKAAGGPPALANGAHLFTGHEREYTGSEALADPLMGLDYMHARYYSNTLGRFLSVDPVGGKPGLSQSWNRYAYVRGNPVGVVDPDGRNAKVTCDDTKKECVVEVDAQIVRDPKDKKQAKAAEKFKEAAEKFWNNQSVKGTNGETIKFKVTFTIVNPGDENPSKDVLSVKTGKGVAAVTQTLNFKDPAGKPDRGVIYTEDASHNPNGLEGVAPHETGHLMGLRDLYVPGQKVPYNNTPNGDIMKFAQPKNSATSARSVLQPNGNNVIIHINATPTPKNP